MAEIIKYLLLGATMKHSLQTLQADLSGYSDDELHAWRAEFDRRILEVSHRLDDYNEGCNSGEPFPREKGFRGKSKRMIGEYRVANDRIRVELKRRKAIADHDIPRRFMEHARDTLPDHVFGSLLEAAIRDNRASL